eukprot:1073091-Amphidinium_carterae.1
MIFILRAQEPSLYKRPITHTQMPKSVFLGVWEVELNTSSEATQTRFAKHRFRLHGRAVA